MVYGFNTHLINEHQNIGIHKGPPKVFGLTRSWINKILLD